MTNKTFVLLLAALPLLACSPKEHDQKAVAVSNVTLTAEQRRNIHVVTVAEAGFHKTVDTSGTVDFDNDHATSVLAPFSGPVTRIFVNPGDHVAKNAPLAEVASPDFATAVSTYRKAVVTARNARRIADADKDMATHQSVSQREADQAQTDATSAEADQEAARQALVSLNVTPQTVKDAETGKAGARGEGLIRAPIAGTVVEKLVTPGQLLQAGSTASFTIADLRRVWVMAQVFGADLNTISVGDRVTVDTGVGGKSLTGRVDNIAAEVDPNTRAVLVRVAVDNPGDVLKKQMYVRTRIEARQESSGLLVPASAILRDDENLPFVYVVQPDGSFARRSVTLGYRSGDRTLIAQGLKAGEQIVVDGAVFVQFMQNQ